MDPVHSDNHNRGRFEGMIEAKLTAMHDDLVEVKKWVKSNLGEIIELRTSVAVLAQRIEDDLSGTRKRAAVFGTAAAAAVSAAIACLRFLFSTQGK